MARSGTRYVNPQTGQLESYPQTQGYENPYSNTGGGGQGGYQPQVPLAETYTPNQQKLEGPYGDLLQTSMGDPNLGYQAPDLSALLGGEAGGSPEAAVKAIYGGMQGDIEKERSRGMELQENRNIAMGRTPQSGTGYAGQAQFLGEFNPKAAGFMASQRLGVAKFGLSAGAQRDAWMQNQMRNYENYVHGGRSTPLSNPYAGMNRSRGGGGGGARVSRPDAGRYDSIGQGAYERNRDKMQSYYRPAEA